MDRKQFWYIVAESKELKKRQVIARTLMGEWLAIFRDDEGRAFAVQDRCLHRCAQLSRGKVHGGNLRCPYHGWTYAGDGRVVEIPSEGPNPRHRQAISYPVMEQDDYIYVRLQPDATKADPSILPFPMPSYRKKGYTTIRLQNTFANTVTNCAENFVDVPHTTFVHPKIFRDPGREKLSATVERLPGHVKVTYRGEKSNFGLFTFFLNPGGGEIKHTDEFLMPNVTTVNYWLGGGKHFIITSQSIPISEKETKVYTDLTYDYGLWTWPTRWAVRKHGQAIIDQDIVILENQMKTIDKYGAHFQNSPADVIHTFIESIQGEIEQGRDPRALPPRSVDIDFWI